MKSVGHLKHNSSPRDRMAGYCSHVIGSRPDENGYHPPLLLNPDNGVSPYSVARHLPLNTEYP